MAPPRQSLTVYRIRSGLAAASYKSLLREHVREMIGAPRLPSVDEYPVPSRRGRSFSGRLFVLRPRARQPAWVEFLEQGISGLKGKVEKSGTPSAVLFVQIQEGNKKRRHRFAFTFGFGRYLLDPAAYEHGVGLKVALNAIYQKGRGSERSRVRSVDMKTVDAATFRTRRQASHQVTFDEFGVDINRDLLSAITGEPVDRDEWGTRITGADALRSNAISSFKEIGDLCRRLVGFENSTDYRERFDWVDKVKTVQSAETVAKLEEKVVDLVARLLRMSARQRQAERVDLAPSELVSWADVAGFRYSLQPEKHYEDLDLGEYLDLAREIGDGEAPDLRTLKQSHRVVAVDDSGDKLGAWSIFRCLDAELKIGGVTYLLVDGQFYQISGKYLRELDDAIESLNEWSGNLIAWDSRRPARKDHYEEGDYNRDAAAKSPHYLNLDADTVRVAGKTTAIEVCDILTSDGDFIHVKRKLRSSSLSHLFGQGAVSADLFRRSRQYREAVHDKIQKAFAAQGADGARLGTGFHGPFARFDPGQSISPGDYQVVYGIIAPWRRRSLVEALPFFAKVNLRRHMSALRAVGYRVSYKRIGFADPKKDPAPE